LPSIAQIFCMGTYVGQVQRIAAIVRAQLLFLGVRS
jgi:hypothetical protein